MSMSNAFKDTTSHLGDILTYNPRAEFLPSLNQRFLQVIVPNADLRVQFSLANEGGIEVANGKRELGRISVTGVMDLYPEKKRGWHVFQLLPDGTIVNCESPSDGSGVTETLLDPDEISRLATWLERHTDEFREN